MVSMPTGERPSKEIAVDFLTELPESEGFNAILVVIDQFTKVQYYIQAKTIWIVKLVAHSCIHNVWSGYGLPRHTNADWAPWFGLNVLQEPNCNFNINMWVSTAYHLQTDKLGE